MIQRIQTVYLFLAAVAAALAIFMPLGRVMTGQTPSAIHITEHLALGVALIGMAAFPLISIFLYANRRLQARIVQLGLIAAAFFIGGFLYTFRAGFADMRPDVWIALPAVYLLLAWLAVRAIRRDDRLIRSADRFR